MEIILFLAKTQRAFLFELSVLARVTIDFDSFAKKLVTVTQGFQESVSLTVV